MIPEEERHKRLPEVGAPCAQNNYLPSGMHRLYQLEWGMQPITHGALRVRESFPRKNNPITHAKESREGARLKQNLQCGTDEYIHWRSSVDCNKASRNALWSQDAPHGLQLSISWKPCQGCCQVLCQHPRIPAGQRQQSPCGPHRHRAGSGQGAAGQKSLYKHILQYWLLAGITVTII